MQKLMTEVAAAGAAAFAFGAKFCGVSFIVLMQSQ